MGYKFCGFVKILILQKIKFADHKHNFSHVTSCPFIFVEIILCFEGKQQNLQNLHAALENFVFLLLEKDEEIHKLKKKLKNMERHLQESQDKLNQRDQALNNKEENTNDDTNEDTNGGNVAEESSDVTTLDPPVDTAPQGM